MSLHSHGLAHTWMADGRDECGDPRIRCARCGMLRTWAGAVDGCSRALRTVLEKTVKKPVKKRKRLGYV